MALIIPDYLCQHKRKPYFDSESICVVNSILYKRM